MHFEEEFYVTSVLHTVHFLCEQFKVRNANVKFTVQFSSGMFLMMQQSCECLQLMLAMLIKLVAKDSLKRSTNTIQQITNSAINVSSF